MHVRFKGGATKTLSVPRARASWEEWKTPTNVLGKIDELLDQHTPAEVASILNAEGHLSG